MNSFDYQRELADQWAAGKAGQTSLEVRNFYANKFGFLVEFADSGSTPGALENGIFVPPAEMELDPFQYPNDPQLPSLAAFVVPNALQQVVAQLFPEAQTYKPTLLSYRPLRRAIMKLEVDGEGFFIRILKPGRIRQSVENHQLLRSAGMPAPEVLWWSESGAMVTREVPGQTAHQSRDAKNESQLLDTWFEARARIANVESKVRRPSSLSGSNWILDRLRQLYPDSALELAELQRRLEAALDEEIAAERTSIVRHGDLHFGQLMLNQQTLELVGVLDLDTLGFGDPADDYAALASQLIRLGEQKGHILRELGESAAREGLSVAASSKTMLQLAAMALSREATMNGGGLALLEIGLALREL